MGWLARLSWLGWLGAIAAMAAPALDAHELGPFQVYGTFQRNGAFTLDLKIDDEHLQESQLGGPARVTRNGPIAGLSGTTEQKFGRYLSDLADSMTLAFDGARVTPDLRMAAGTPGSEIPATGGPDPGAPRRATLQVTGWIPGGAHAFTFKSSLPVKYYPLILSCEGDEASTWRWLAGRETSPPFTLAPRVVPPPPSALVRRDIERGFAAVLPHGPLLLLLVMAIFLLAPRPSTALLHLATLEVGNALGTAIVMLAGSEHGGSSADLLRLLRPALRESLLALSLTCLAIICLMPRRQRLRPAIRRPELALLILIIGLLATLTFAPTIVVPMESNSPMTPPLLAVALASYNLGSLGAELAVLLAAFALIGLPLSGRPWYRRRVVVPASCLIAIMGLYWSMVPLFASGW